MCLATLPTNSGISGERGQLRARKYASQKCNFWFSTHASPPFLTKSKTDWNEKMFQLNPRETYIKPSCPSCRFQRVAVENGSAASFSSRTEWSAPDMKTATSTVVRYPKNTLTMVPLVFGGFFLRMQSTSSELRARRQFLWLELNRGPVTSGCVVFCRQKEKLSWIEKIFAIQAVGLQWWKFKFVSVHLQKTPAVWVRLKKSFFCC